MLQMGQDEYETMIRNAEVLAAHLRDKKAHSFNKFPLHAAGRTLRTLDA